MAFRLRKYQRKHRKRILKALNNGEHVLYCSPTGSGKSTVITAVIKALEKGVDLLVANDVTEDGSGFGTDTNRVTIMTPDGSIDTWPLLPKRQVADRLWDLVQTIRPT